MRRRHHKVVTVMLRCHGLNRIPRLAALTNEFNERAERCGVRPPTQPHHFTFRSGSDDRVAMDLVSLIEIG